MPAMKTIATLRKRKDLERELGIDVVKMGRAILMESSSYSGEMDEVACRKAFYAAARKIE